MRLVVHPPRGEDWRRALRSAAPGVEIVEAEEGEVGEAIHMAEAFYGRIRPEWLAGAPRLRWIQSPVAGLEHIPTATTMSKTRSGAPAPGSESLFTTVS